KKIDELEARFPFGPPSLVDCASLSVTGDVLFERDVVCIGEVRVVNSMSGQATIPAETRIQGDLRFD
ncbi:MAG: UTP--glucose-1-phosphate uridylyltransferase, partial [Desulfohalobiaceae bacterium]